LCLAPWLEGLQPGKGELDRLLITAGRVICKLSHGGRDFGNLLALPVLGDGHGLAHRRHEDGGEVPGPLAAPFRVAGLAFAKAGVKRRFASHSRHHNKVLSCLPSTFLGEFGKTLPAHGMPRDLARIGLPSADDRADIERIEFHTVACAAGALRGNERLRGGSY